MLRKFGQYAFSHKKTTMLALLLVIVASSGFNYAHAQTATGSGLQSGGVYFATFLVGAIFWSLSGFINNIRNHANYLQAHPGNNPPDPTWSGFDPGAMKDDIFIGLILGTVAFITTASTSIPMISTVQGFLAAVLVAYGAVASADKVIVGSLLNR